MLSKYILKDIAIALALTILLPVLVFQVSDLLYKVPKDFDEELSTSLDDTRQELDFHKTAEKFVTSAQQLEAHQQKTKELTVAIKQLEKKHNELRKQTQMPTKQALFILATIIGLIAIIAGFFIPITGLSTGFIGGGTISIFMAFMTSWDFINDYVRFGALILAIVLIITLGFYKRITLSAD